MIIIRNPMKTFEIVYRFKLSDDTREIIRLELDAERMELIVKPHKDPPPWTRLEFHQCTNCTLSDKHVNCPLSLNLVDIVARFSNIVSHDKLFLDVITNDRCISLNTTVQAAISSLMGLVMATSGCPHTVFFKPMARFHLPLAGEEETLYRAASMYLLSQYFLKKDGAQWSFEFEGLKKIYENIQVVNEGMAERLKSASKSDSSPNALTRLDLYAKVIPYFVEDKLESIRYLFDPYLPG